MSFGYCPTRKRRSPHGERGLKHVGEEQAIQLEESLPPRGAWIETYRWDDEKLHLESLPPRGAWIETRLEALQTTAPQVAPPTGSVD